MSYTYTDKIKFAYTPNFDAFSRLRISNPLTLFDSSHRFRDNEHWATSISGGGTATFDSNEGLIKLDVGPSNGDQVLRETYKVFAYQPGKSLLALNTFVFNSAKSGLRQRVGYFGTLNGFYLQLDDSTLSLVERSSVTGVTTNTQISRFGGVYGGGDTGWNVDPLDGTGPSGYSLDISKSQILFMDFEWLGVGSVRCGFVINGEFCTCHVFHHANLINSTYMTTACLPMRYEITNTTATATSSTLKQICSSVISEGGYELRGSGYSISPGITTPSTLALAGTYYPIVSLRLKSSALDSVVIPTGTSVLPKDAANYAWRIVEGGTTTGGSWVSAGTNSTVEYNISGTSFSGGQVVKESFFSSTNQASGGGGLTRENLFQFQFQRNSFTSTAKEFTLCIGAETVLGGGNKVWGAIDWEEITR